MGDTTFHCLNFCPDKIFQSSGGFGGFSGGVEAKGGASSSDLKEAAKEVTVDKVHASYNVRSTDAVQRSILIADPIS